MIFLYLKNILVTKNTYRYISGISFTVLQCGEGEEIKTSNVDRF